MNNCPVCGSDQVKSESCGEMQISTANCLDCGFGFQARVPEEDICSMWNVIEHFSEDEKNNLLGRPQELQCPICGRTELEPYCAGDECTCGGVLAVKKDGD